MLSDTAAVTNVGSDAERSPFAVAVATFGTVCVLVAAAAILRPLAGGSSVGAAVVAFTLFVAVTVAAERFGHPDDGDVAAAVSDVCSAGGVAFLASAAGALVQAGDGDGAVPVVAAVVALPYAVFAQRRRPGPWVALATAVAAVVAVIAPIHLVSDVPTQAYAAGLLLLAVVLAVAGELRWLLPTSVVEASSALTALAATTSLLSDSAAAGDVALALVLVGLIAVVAARSKSASLVAALAAAAPVVVALALGRIGYGWWSAPLAMAWAGAGCAALAAYVHRAGAAPHLGGVFAWCCTLVIVADLFLAESTRLHALVAVVSAGVLFIAAASCRRRPVAVLAALTVLGALPRLVANAAAGRVVLLAIGVGLVYGATTLSSRRGRRT